MNSTFLSLLSGLAAATWSVWTWQSERQKEREIRRNEMSAQYVNNLIVITQELQHNLFKILEEDELLRYASENKHTGGIATTAATDLLCQLSNFFGWDLMTFRFGPYTRDSKMIAIMAEIGEVMQSRTLFPGDAFRFRLGDRHALGLAVLRRVGDTACGPAFVSITRFKFEEEMQNENSEWARVFRSEEIRRTLAAVDRAILGEPLEGRERLAAFQNLLVDLLSYLEKKEGFRVSFGVRGRAKLAMKHDHNYSTPCPDFRIVHHVQGRMRLRVPRLLTDDAYASELKSLIQSVDNVQNVRINLNVASVVIEYSDYIPSQTFSKILFSHLQDKSSSGLTLTVH